MLAKYEGSNTQLNTLINEFEQAYDIFQRTSKEH